MLDFYQVRFCDLKHFKAVLSEVQHITKAVVKASA